MNKIKSLRGMHDILPRDLNFFWNKIKRKIIKILKIYSFNEICTPILEKTTLFKRSIDSQIINKEMYNFNDKNGCSITLRPEATASCVRSVIENNLLLSNKILKIWYYGPMFRYERPQKGRFRQFFQIGAEIFGLKGSEIELETLLLIKRLWDTLKINKLIYLEINTIGYEVERLEYINNLHIFFKKKKIEKKILKKFKNNFLKILDSKNLEVKKLLFQVPILKNYLSKQSINNFNILCDLLKKFNLPYNINYNLVRGLDYYNDVVFEWKTKKVGSQNTICAGGRYDTLFNKLGNNKNIPALGFAIGMERLILLFKKDNFYTKNKINVFISYFNIKNKIAAIRFSEKIRNFFPKLNVVVDYNNFFFKKKKYISKLNIDLLIFIGNRERKNNYVSIKICKKNIHKIIFNNKIYSFIKKFFKINYI